MANWVRFAHNDQILFGVLENDVIFVYEGTLFGGNTPSGKEFAAADVVILPPCKPGKIIALWNNFHALAEKQNNRVPDSPLYFIKPSSCVIGPDGLIVKPASYAGRIFYEGELGIVIGKTCRSVSQADALFHVKGYTCVNDVTAMQLIHEDASFQQWTRAKSFDTFGALGPTIAELDDPAGLTVKTLVNGRERQNYQTSDMIFSPASLVSLISHDMTLEPGDVIACGTSLGALPMKPGTVVEITIEGIGTLSNRFVEQAE